MNISVDLDKDYNQDEMVIRGDEVTVKYKKKVKTNDDTTYDEHGKVVYIDGMENTTGTKVNFLG